MKKFLLEQAITLFISFSIILSSPTPNTCHYSKLDTTRKIEAGASSAVRALEGFSNFAINIFKDVVDDINDPDENIFLSPLSVWSALTATYLGANGETASELSRVLGLDNMSRQEIAEAYRILKIWYYLRTEGQTKEKYIFQMANKLFFQDGEPVTDCIKGILDSEIMMENFSSTPEIARADINGWVKEQTRGKINEIVPPGFVDRATKMILVNAAYFKGTWEKQFPKYLTDERQFHVEQDRPIYISMMHQNEVFNVAKDTELNYSMVELPYIGNEISMFIVLPSKSTTAEKLIRQLTVKRIKQSISNLKPTSISLSLPRFDMEQASELCANLRHMGITTLFNPTLADLSGFTGKADFFVSKASHKVFINVNEKGTEAAAVTSLISVRSGIVPEAFRVDRPFIFIIRDNILNTILFLGLVRNPHE